MKHESRPVFSITQQSPFPNVDMTAESPTDRLIAVRHSRGTVRRPTVGSNNCYGEAERPAETRMSRGPQSWRMHSQSVNHGVARRRRKSQYQTSRRRPSDDHIDAHSSWVDADAAATLDR